MLGRICLRYAITHALAATLGLVAATFGFAANAEERPSTGEASAFIANEALSGESGPFTIERLYALARERKTIEATIQALPLGLRSRYALMYRSRGSQDASFRAPRAILFERDGSFLLTFNGDPGQRGFDKLEAIQFRSEQKRWELREIAFAAPTVAAATAPTGLGAAKSLTEGLGAASPFAKTPGADAFFPSLSEANPLACLKCHQSARGVGADPRPNWEPYDIWPGAYGGVDGSPGRMLEPELHARFGDLGPVQGWLDEQKGEASQLMEFLRRGKPLSDRYRALGPFLPRATVDLAAALVDRNDERVGRLAASAPDWRVYRDLFAQLLFCGDGGDGSPRARLPLLAPPEIAIPQYKLFDLAKLSLPPERFRGFLSEVFELVFGARGIDLSDWGMDFETGGRYAARDRFGSPTLPLRQMRDGVAPALAFRSESGFGPAIVNGFSPGSAAERDAAACRAATLRAQEDEPSLRASGALGEAASKLEARLQAELERRRP